jgi:von Willebrand factor type A domain
MLAQTVSIRSNGAELVGGVEGAVDRIAIEILRRLEQGRTLVVWAFDASGSLLAERQRVSKHIDTAYSHINQLDGNRLSSKNGLLTMVLSFGQDRHTMLPKPTADRSEVISAIKNVELDTSGIETTFTTVAEIVNRWGRFKNAQGLPYHPMIIVVTDEVGDDQGRLEDAVTIAQRAKVPVYVLGSQVIFGRVDGYVDYVDRKSSTSSADCQCRRGPKARRSSRSAFRSGTAARNTTLLRPGLVHTL